MKRFTLIGILVLVALTGCTREPVPTPDKRGVISWDAGMENGSATKAYPTGYGAYPTAASFGAFALQTGDHWADAHTFSAYINNEEVSYSQDPETSQYAWTTYGEYYWPQSGYLHFAAYSPYSTLHSYVTFSSAKKDQGLTIGESTPFVLPTNKVNQTYITELGTGNILAYDYDLLVSEYTDADYDCAETAAHGFQPVLDGQTDPASQYGSGYKPGVHTRFRHIMTRLCFQFKMGNVETSYNQRIYVQSIKLTNLQDKGTYKSGKTDNSGAWALDNHQETESVLYSVTDEQIRSGSVTPITSTTEATVLVDNYFALPQTLRDELDPTPQQLTITYQIYTVIDGVIYWDKTVETPATLLRSGAVQSWEKGKMVTYTISLSPAQTAISFTASMEAWPASGSWNVFTITG